MSGKDDRKHFCLACLTVSIFIFLTNLHSLFFPLHTMPLSAWRLIKLLPSQPLPPASSHHHHLSSISHPPRRSTQRDFYLCTSVLSASHVGHFQDVNSTELHILQNVHIATHFCVIFSKPCGLLCLHTNECLYVCTCKKDDRNLSIYCLSFLLTLGLALVSVAHQISSLFMVLQLSICCEFLLVKLSPAVKSLRVSLF